MRIIYLFLVSSLLSINLPAQDAKINMGVLKFKMLAKTYSIFSNNNVNQLRNAVNSSEAYIIERLLEDKRVNVVERSKLNLVNKELDLQRSENFMDGYIVEQDRQIGADYLISGLFNPDNKEFVISMFSVEEGKVINKKTIPFKSNIWGQIKYKTAVQDAVSKIMSEEFPVLIPLIEIIKGDSKAKEVLVAGGTKNGFKKEDKISFYIYDERVVGGKTLKREKTISEGKVIEVENENFSRVKITKNKKELKSYFDKGIEINCKLKR